MGANGDNEEILRQGSSYQEFSGLGDDDRPVESSDESGNSFGRRAKSKLKDGVERGASKLAGSKKWIVLAAIVCCIVGGGLILVMFDKVSGRGFDPKEDIGNTPTPTEPVSEEYDNSVESWFTAAEVNNLRLAGYTGWEIEWFAEDEMDAASLIEYAEQERKAKLEEEMKPYIDSQSEEYKQLAATTWVGLDSLEVSENVTSYKYKTKTANLDYEKLEPKGHQLFIKLYLEDGCYCFMQVSPERFVTLKPAGNIVVTIDYVVMDNNEEVITKLVEKEIK